MVARVSKGVRICTDAQACWLLKLYLRTCDNCQAIVTLDIDVLAHPLV